ncbi:copper resistance CopC/CopD family protein [Bosea sp. (in: a-proteobacteria)]|uniref:copper resistance CopC/CopD family protein n=1 Tax=Bosea sp. (in: a-proteobacteria) TaxID=1871050 RepID=UPI002734EAAA|nr:copper resistance CopC/CopD family protein [Bosea sp. (in: a-proteobacteria)]MDP3410375.1 copper resistance CopC/CopD family protein [Bosea sp. (in: a-proteobacteria)]
MAARLRLILVLIGLLAVALAPASRAFAHAALNGASPADGSVLPSAPSELTLTFSEPVSPLALRLIRPDGQATPLERADLRDRTLVIAAPAGLGEGTHVLSWRVVSADGHPVGGSVLFSIGAPSPTAPTAGTQTDAMVRVLLWASRVALYLGLFIGCGGAAFAAWVAPLPARARGPVTAALLLGLVALPLSLAAQGLDALGADLRALFQPPVWRAALGTSLASTLAIAAAALASCLLALRLAGGLGKIAGLFGVGLAGLALASSGHASAASPQALMRPAVFLHAAGIALWAGALLPLIRALRQPDAAATLRRFSWRIPAIVAMLLGSGLVLAVVQVERPAALIDTDYGRVLLAKLGLVALVLGLAALNRWRLTSQVQAGRLSACHLMARIVAVELVLMLAILGTAALWRFTPPPRALAIAAAQPANIHIHTLTAMADVTLTPGRAGPIVVAIVLMNGDFGPLPAKELTLSFANPTAGIEAIERPAIRGADGVWRIEGLSLPRHGRWSVELAILISDFEMIRLTETVEIRP